MYWQEKINLMDWRIDIYLRDLEKDTAAEVQMDFSSKVASITLSDTHPFPWHKKVLDRTAFHEVCEILLSELGYMATLYVKGSEVEEAVHKVIRTLENCVIPDCRGKM